MDGEQDKRGGIVAGIIIFIVIGIGIFIMTVGSKTKEIFLTSRKKSSAI